MKRAEIILGGLIVLFMTLRLFYAFPYMNIAIILLTMVLSITYLFLGFAFLNKVRLRNIFKKDAYNGISALRILGTIFTGFVLSQICIYSLFKYMRWPYGNQGLVIALNMLLVILVIVVIKLIISKKRFYMIFLIRLMIFVFLGIFMFFFPDETILEMKNRNDPEYIEAEKERIKEMEDLQFQQSKD